MSNAEAIGLGIMCKPPRPGLTKTRLARAIGDHAAVKLSEAFLRDCAEAAFQAGRLTPIARAAFYRPKDAESEVTALLGPEWPATYADAGDLGRTMYEVLGALLAQCPAGAMIMGADVPTLNQQLIADAARLVRAGTERDVVIIPSADGGYCLIGAKSRASIAPLFTDMRWSMPDVLDVTLRRARQHGLRASLLPAQRDIDTLDDLTWLQDEILTRQDGMTHTRRALAALASSSPAQDRAPRESADHRRDSACG